MSLFDVVAQLVVGDAANAEKPVSPALGCAIVEATATSHLDSCSSLLTVSYTQVTPHEEEMEDLLLSL